MYYVIQVAPGAERGTESLIKAKVSHEVYGTCFHPVRCVKKKLRGEWKNLHEKLIPGYVFITSDSVHELYQELQRVPAFTKLLGSKEGSMFIPLPANEIQWLEGIMDKGTEVSLSQVMVSEGDNITILSGPLKNFEGCIKKINLHKRIAAVQVNFMNRSTILHLGIEMVKKENEGELIRPSQL